MQRASRPTDAWLDSATTPPAASITAAASCVGATVRNTACGPAAATGRANARAPRTAEAAAAHRHSTPAMSMGSQYESARPRADRAGRSLRQHWWRGWRGSARRWGHHPEPVHDRVGGVGRVGSSLAVGLGGDRQRYEIFVVARGLDDMSPRRVQSHVVLAIGAL